MPLAGSSAQESLLSFDGLQRGRCVLDVPVMFALQDSLDWLCWLLLDHILARKLSSASVSRQRIPKAEWVYPSLYNCREVEYGHTASFGPCHLPVTGIPSPGLFSSWIATLECPTAAAIHLSKGRANLAYLTGLDKSAFQKLCEVEGLCKHVSLQTSCPDWVSAPLILKTAICCLYHCACAA